MASYTFKRQVESIITLHGGMIFGGHVRDVILHEHDPNWLPPATSDIDCYMKSHSLPVFKEALKDAHITLYTEFEREDASAYIPTIDVPRNVLRHHRYKLGIIDDKNIEYVDNLLQQSINQSAQQACSEDIRTFLMSLRRASVLCEPLFIDMFIADCHNFHLMYPPFGTIDFECNGLLMTSCGIVLSPHLYSTPHVLEMNKKLQKVIDDICSRKAVHVAEDISTYRITKMRGKGWSVDMQYVKAIEDVPATDVCIFCHEDVCGKHFKLACCNAVYHKDCLMRVLASEYGGACIMCKRKTLAHRDIALLKIE